MLKVALNEAEAPGLIELLKHENVTKDLSEEQEKPLKAWLPVFVTVKVFVVVLATLLFIVKERLSGLNDHALEYEGFVSIITRALQESPSPFALALTSVLVKT